MMDNEETKLRIECLKLASQDTARSSYTGTGNVLERAKAYYEWVAKGALPEDKED